MLERLQIDKDMYFSNFSLLNLVSGGGGGGGGARFVSGHITPKMGK